MTTRRDFAVSLRRLGAFDVSLRRLGGQASSRTTSPPFITKRTSSSSRTSSRRVAGDRDQVGVQARLDAADPVLPAHQLGGVQRRGPDRLERRLPVPHVVGELAGVQAVRVDAAVGAVGDADAGGDALLEAPRAGVRVVSSFLRRTSAFQPCSPADLGDVVAAVDVGDQPGAALGHQRDALVVHQRAVLDRVDAAADGALDALGAVRVRRDVGAVQARPPRRRRGSGPRSARARRGRRCRTSPPRWRSA